MKTTDFEVGQTVYYMETIRKGRQLQPYVIVGVGRKWVTAAPNLDSSKWSQIRFSPLNMLADGGAYTAPGCFYLSEAQYQEELETERVWRQIQEVTRFSAPSHLSLEQMREILVVLKGPA